MADTGSAASRQCAVKLRRSLIVPVLNEETEIEATLATVQAMRASGTEVILVDGGSRDATTRLALSL